jgi:NAD(P) transhydrogenase subunit beta
MNDVAGPVNILAAVDAATSVVHAATPWYVWVSYLVAAALFVLSLKWLSHPRSARRGVRAGEIGMALAIVGTLLMYVGVSTTLKYALIGMVLGSLIGAPMAIWMPMTAVPQRTALSHAFGALAAALVGTAHYYDFFGSAKLDHFTMAILALEVLLGSLTFTGSLVAFGKLQELIPSSIKGLANQNAINFSLLGSALACGLWLTLFPTHYLVFPLLLILGLAFGICPMPACRPA